jgi:PAS domain S-box-containing protein
LFTAFRDLPIRHKLMRISMLVSTSVLLLASLGFIVYELVTFRDTMVQNLSTQAEIIGINTVSALLFNDPASATQTMTALRAKPNIVSGAIYTVDGKLFARYVRSDGTTIFQMPEQIAEKEAGYRFDGGYLFYSRPIVSDGQRIGMVYIQSDLNEMEIRMKRYASIVFGVLAISLLTAYGVSSRLQGRISGPILHLARTAKTVSEQKNYSVRAIADSRDEIGQLVNTFNEMLTQIQIREGALKKAHDELERRVEERTRELQQEIAERKQAEETVKESEQRLDLALDSAQMGAWDLDLINDTAVRSLKHDQIFGYSSLQPQWGSEIFLTHVVPEDRDLVKKRFDEAFATSHLSMECRIIWPDQSRHWIAAQGRVYRNHKGDPVRMMGVVTDITERKQAEDAIRKLNEDLQGQTSQLQAANKEMEAFSYSVSHDLRAPLRHVDGFSQILLEDYAEKLDDQGRRYLHQVREASQRMAQLIDDLLNLSRITRSELRRQSVDLSRMVETVAEALKKTEPDRAVEFVIQKGMTTEGDARLLRVLLDNLLGNAWKYTGKRSEARIEFGRTARDGKAAYFVRDNGAGFDMAYVHKLFGAFQRLHSVSEFPGTGIGLATVQRIVHRHGGQVWAEGVLDQGATFYFTL